MFPRATRFRAKENRTTSHQHYNYLRPTTLLPCLASSLFITPYLRVCHLAPKPRQEGDYPKHAGKRPGTLCPTAQNCKSDLNHKTGAPIERGMGRDGMGTANTCVSDSKRPGHAVNGTTGGQVLDFVHYKSSRWVHSLPFLMRSVRRTDTYSNPLYTLSCVIRHEKPTSFSYDGTG